MGNQQLLLIALGVIIVGVAIVVSIDLTKATFAEQVQDMTIHKVHDIGMRANAYRKKSDELGGGNGSYKGFSKQLNEVLKTDDIVEKFKLKERDDNIEITLTLRTEDKNNRAYRVWARYEPDGLNRARIFEPSPPKWVWIYKKE